MCITKLIEFNGKAFETKLYREVRDEEFAYIRQKHYEKPPFEEVQKQFRAVAKVKWTNGLITKFYVKDLMEKTKKRKSKFGCVKNYAQI